MKHWLAVFAMAAGLALEAHAGSTRVALQASDVGTLHVRGQIDHARTVEFLLDTGSAHVVLAESTRRELERAGKLTPLRHLRALLANNASVRAPVYRIAELDLGDGCVIRDFEAVALPGARKNILGLSALKSVAPFTVHLDPDQLELTCAPATPWAADGAVASVH
ncbi:MAG: TIGR02281 family clan AA aspartic protease [Gammaproteobacteria bacterium]